MEGEHVGARCADEGADAFDLGHAGQEHQQVSVASGVGGLHGAGHVGQELAAHADAPAHGSEGLGPARGRGPPHVQGVDGAGDADERGGGARRLLQQAGRAGGLQGGGGEGDEEVFAQGGARVQQEREGEVGVEVPLVELVQEHACHCGQFGVPLEPAQQDARGDHFDAGGAGGGGVAAHRVADLAAHLFAEEACDAAGGGAHGDAARLGDQDPARALAVGLGQCCGEGGGDQGGLAGSGGSGDDGAGAGAGGGGDSGQRGRDGQVGRVRYEVLKRAHATIIAAAPGRRGGGDGGGRGLRSVGPAGHCCCVVALEWDGACGAGTSRILPPHGCA